MVAFVSDATNLVPDDHNGVSDVFVSQGGTIKRVSLGANFASNPAVIINGTALNVFVRGVDNQIYTEYNGGSGWSGWSGGWVCRQAARCVCWIGATPCIT